MMATVAYSLDSGEDRGSVQVGCRVSTFVDEDANGKYFGFEVVEEFGLESDGKGCGPDGGLKLRLCSNHEDQVCALLRSWSLPLARDCSPPSCAGWFCVRLTQARCVKHFSAVPALAAA